jgi:Fe-S-cluster-containing hydrogenase component 2
MFGFSKNAEAPDNSNKKLAVSKLRCPQNHPCPSIRVCPTGALSQKGYAAPSVDQAKCIKCGKCVRYCPMRALTLE